MSRAILLMFMRTTRRRPVGVDESWGRGTSAPLSFVACVSMRRQAAQASNALTSVIADAGVPGSLRYCFVVPVAVSDTRIT